MVVGLISTAVHMDNPLVMGWVSLEINGNQSI